MNRKRTRKLENPHRRNTDKWGRLLVETMNQGVIVQDDNGSIIYVNERLCEILGYSQDEIIGRSATEFLDETNQIVWQDRLAMLQTGTQNSHDIEWIRRDGRKIYTTMSPKEINHPEGLGKAIFTVISDITAQKHAARTLLLLSSAVEQSPVSVLIADPGCNIEYVNPRFAQVHGNRSRGVGHEHHMPEKYRQVWETLTTLGAWAGEILEQQENGEFYWGSVVLSSIRDAHGRITHFLALEEDITANKQAEEALRRSEQELRLLSTQLLTAQEAERKRLASELHDGIGQHLSTIKFGIEGILELIGEHSIEAAQTPLAKLTSIVRRAIENATTEVYQMMTNLRPLILDDLGIVATIHWYCREFQAIHLELHIDEEIMVDEHDVPPPVKIAIYRILQEALNNIGKHAGASRVSVRLCKSNDTLELVISDNGRGFEWQPLSTTESGRCGLGLVSMRERTELSGGLFSLKSSDGTGTVIRAAWAC